MLNFIKQNESLADKTWFKTGGSARFFSAPHSDQEFADSLAFAAKNNLDIFLMGEGANILISDSGFDGLVIRPQLKNISITDQENTHALVTAQSGASMHELITFCLENNLGGLEEFSGIPGTVGGSVYINLHYFQFLLSEFLAYAQIIEKKTGTITTVIPDWFNFGYNTSKLLEKNHYLLSATFKLKKLSSLETAFAQGRRSEIIRHRTARYPNQKTCGSFFRNFYPNEVNLEQNGKKIIFVAYYLDKIGVKGALCHGDARVSYQHANMIVNGGNASSDDIISVARRMQELVYENFGIIPQPECQLIGFKTYPLLQINTIENQNKKDATATL